MISNFKPLTIIASLILCVSATNAAEPLTQEQIAQKEKESVNQSDVGLVSKLHTDGTISRDLKGRFQMFSRVVIDADGNKKFICTAHPDADFAKHSHQIPNELTKNNPAETKKVAR